MRKPLKDIAARIKLSAKIEAACRELCENNGLDPDRLVCKMMPEYINFPIPTFYCPNPQFTMPAWWLFRDIVEQAIKIVGKTKC